MLPNPLFNRAPLQECWSDAAGCGAWTRNATSAYIKIAAAAAPSTQVRIDNANTYECVLAVAPAPRACLGARLLKRPAAAARSPRPNPRPFPPLWMTGAEKTPSERAP